MRLTLYFLFVILSLCYTFPQASQPLQCSSFQSDGYHCVPYFHCNGTGYIVVDGEGIFDSRAIDGEGIFDSRATDDEFIVDHKKILEFRCDKLLQVCCRHPNPGKKDGGLISTLKYLVNKKTTTPPKPTCGKRNEEGVGSEPQLSVRGRLLKVKGDSTFGEWPHVCAVLKQKLSEDGVRVNLYHCAGSLISKEVVLTAAHCVKNAYENNEKIFIRCGEWDTSNTDEIFPYQEKNVVESIIHPDFNENNLHNDFALLITEEDFDLAEHISPVCLPFPGDRFKPRECVSNGWGKDKLGSKGRYQTRLKTIHLPLVRNEECQRRLQETRLGHFFQLDDSFICAGGDRGIDTCKGDGGGPLTCRHDESSPWVQVGIVSWGVECGNDVPAVYANVAKAVCWIDKHFSCYFAEVANSTFSDSTVIPSYFGFSPEDCPGDLAIRDCNFVDKRSGDKDYDSNYPF